jgi:acyl-CoA thioesterase
MHDKMSQPIDILQKMWAKDSFSKWLGIIIDEYKTGYCRLHFTVRDEMLNGFEIVHGGVLFSAADSAFAFACNSHGKLSVALDANINFVRPARSGEIITVTATEQHSGNRTGFYDITIENEQKELVAMFRGTAYRTSRTVME